MKNLPEKQLRFNEEVWINATTDIIRKKECMCLFCSNMTYSKETNCPIAQQLYELCCKENIAFIMTMCKRYRLKD